MSSVMSRRTWSSPKCFWTPVIEIIAVVMAFDAPAPDSPAFVIVVDPRRWTGGIVFIACRRPVDVTEPLPSQRNGRGALEAESGRRAGCLLDGSARSQPRGLHDVRDVDV